MRPPIEFLDVGVANPLITQMLFRDNFFMNTKFVDLTEVYKLGFHKKIVTQKHFGDQGVCHTNIEKFYRSTRLAIARIRDGHAQKGSTTGKNKQDGNSLDVKFQMSYIYLYYN